jgi:uncharacterized protein YceH (UPF0502 family)
LDLTLKDVEARVIASLIEKELTTPEYYPLTLNSLKLACNQKSNRHPVVDYDDNTVLSTIDSLRDKGLVLMVTGGGSRVAKYRHSFREHFQLSERQVAALGVLMLRGPQTVGEIRGRTTRMYEFESLDEVQQTLDELTRREEGPYVVQLPKRTGQKDVRFAHLLCGEPSVEPVAENGEPASDRLAELEEEISTLRRDLEALREDFAQFRKEFE